MTCRRARASIPGRRFKAGLIVGGANTSAITAALRIKVYGVNDRLFDMDGPPLVLAPGDKGVLSWTLPDLDGQPIQEIGVALTSSNERADGIVWLDFLRWDGDAATSFFGGRRSRAISGGSPGSTM